MWHHCKTETGQDCYDLIRILADIKQMLSKVTRPGRSEHNGHTKPISRAGAGCETPGRKNALRVCNDLQAPEIEPRKEED